MTSKLISLFDKALDFIKRSNEDEQKTEQPPSHPHNEEIINQLIEFQIGTRSQIMKAIEMVNDKNNIEEIAEYLMTMPTDNQVSESTNIPQHKTNPNSDKVTILMSMGYDINLVTKALEIANNDTQIAAQYLIDGLINTNEIKPIQYTQPTPTVSKPKPKPKPIEFENVNDKSKVYTGALMQIVDKSNKDPINDFWNEANIGSLYDESLRGLIGMIQCIYSNNHTIKIQTCDEKEYIVPIKACVSIKYDKPTEKTDQLLVSGYIRCISISDNIPPLANQLCYKYYHIVKLRLACDDSKEEDLLITRNACKLSKYLDSINLLLDNKISRILIEGVPYITMKMVIEWLNYHNGIEPKALPCPVTSVIMKEIVGDIWDADYIDNKDKKTIFEIILVANKLKIKHLLHLGSAKIATLIKQMDQSEINRIIEEEERYRREHINDS